MSAGGGVAMLVVWIGERSGADDQQDEGRSQSFERISGRGDLTRAPGQLGAIWTTLGL